MSPTTKEVVEDDEEWKRARALSDASLAKENALLRKRLATTEATLRRVRGERADLERVKAIMKRNSRLRRQLGVTFLVCYSLYACCWNMRFLGFYNWVRGGPSTVPCGPMAR